MKSNERSFERQRVARIFVSSTFLDMQREREELVKAIFPELRRRCRERGIEFVDVDLRWGVTEEQTQRGEALPTCLLEISRCAPYFVALLGGRYGWVPPSIDAGMVEDHAWIGEYKGRSITELEILHGALNHADHRRKAFFYFRDEDASGSIEQELVSVPGYQSEPPEYRSRLEELKQKILDGSVPLPVEIRMA